MPAVAHVAISVYRISVSRIDPGTDRAKMTQGLYSSVHHICILHRLCISFLLNADELKCLSTELTLMKAAELTFINIKEGHLCAMAPAIPLSLREFSEPHKLCAHYMRLDRAWRRLTCYTENEFLPRAWDRCRSDSGQCTHVRRAERA